MTIPPFETTIGNHHYYRSGKAISVTKAAAIKKAKDLRKEGHLARVVKDSVGSGWTVYFAANSRTINKFKKSLPEEIRHLVG